MSTRCVIAESTGEGFTNGVYVHSDGYPTHIGPTLQALYRNLGSAQAVWDTISAKAFWSILDAVDPVREQDDQTVIEGVGRHYDDQPESNNYTLPLPNDETPSRWQFEEWAYAINPDNGNVCIYSGAGKPLALFNLADEIDWPAIETKAEEAA